MRQAVIYQDEDGVWIAEVSSPPGCHTAGDSAEDAMESIKDAIVAWVDHATAHGLSIPQDPGTAEIRAVRDTAA